MFLILLFFIFLILICIFEFGEEEQSNRIVSIGVNNIDEMDVLYVYL